MGYILATLLIWMAWTFREQIFGSVLLLVAGGILLVTASKLLRLLHAILDFLISMFEAFGNALKHASAEGPKGSGMVWLRELLKKVVDAIAGLLKFTK